MPSSIVITGMSNEKKKTPVALDLRDVLREVLASAREESAEKGAEKPQSDASRQPNQP
jgi:hypothetical protein